MIIKLLTRGALVKGFIAFLWIVAGFARFTDHKSDPMISFTLICVAAFVLYSAIAVRMLVIISQASARLLPNFYPQLKQALFKLIALSILPSLLLLPHWQLWLASMSIMLLLATVFVLTVYYKVALHLVTLLVMGDLALRLFDKKVRVLSGFSVDFIQLLSFALPVLVALFYLVITRLEQIKGDEKYMQKALAYATQSSGRLSISLDRQSSSNNTKVQRFIVTKAIDHYRTALQSDLTLSPLAKFKIATIFKDNVGATNYHFLMGFITLLALLGWFLIKKQLISTELVYIFTLVIASMIYGLGVVYFFQALTRRKLLLRQLAMTPSFASASMFAKTFVQFVIFEQLKVFCAIGFIVFAGLASINNISSLCLLNFSAMALVLFFIGTSFMLVAIAGNKRIASGLQYLLIVLASVVLVIISVMNDQQIVIVNFVTFQLLLASSLGIFVIVAYRSGKLGRACIAG